MLQYVFSRRMILVEVKKSKKTIKEQDKMLFLKQGILWVN